MPANLKNAFLETGWSQLSKAGNQVCGDTILTRRIQSENRYVAVLSDGLGSGIRASVLSTMTAGMALNFTLCHEPVKRTAETIMRTLPVDSKRNISYSTFTILDVDCQGDMSIVEYDNPPLFLIRNLEIIFPQREDVAAEGPAGFKTMHLSQLSLKPGDRIVVVSDGVVQSGIGGAVTPFGWEIDGLTSYVQALLVKIPDISARDLAARIVSHSHANDHLIPADDISSLVFYYREPRRLLICSGPPYDNSRDAYLASRVDSFAGRKIICGGTTAQILARELNRLIDVDLTAPMFGVPPESRMDGIDMITEGILTLGKLAETLATGDFDSLSTESPIARIISLVMDSDIIELLTGTRINQAHQDPALPMELEIRRNVVKRIARILEEKYMKEVKVSYI
ncbi:MAG TPA: stage II sporulation protein E [Bacteroidales bacterium]|nr:MAG: hypothetical protein A2X11_04285 [Bacteroidetes bacterium GWE2_42_24]OFY25253.1 MAG: hypothetical protein A2X09_11010 [Bacteroidetes bacterium GWF2_43_11]HAQ65939.1 stage II sporulation protein E [Bacteroidales bacterium]HBZ66955.1 stage II sporulation protein E [Bacteroidales bacterium]